MSQAAKEGPNRVASGSKKAWRLRSSLSALGMALITGVATLVLAAPPSTAGASTTYVVTVTGSQTYGGTPTFNADPASGPTQPYSGTLTCTTVNGGTPIASTLAAAGSYTIDGSSCSGLSLTGDDADNYTISYVGSSFAVNQAVYPVTVTGSQTYGGTPTFNADPASGPTQPYSGTLTCTTVNGGTPIASTLAAAGSYTIDGSSCSGLSLTGDDADNYTISYVGSSFAVNQAVYPVTVTGSQTYGGTPTFNADPASGPTQPYSGTLTCTTVNGGTPIASTLAAAGSYTIDGSSCSGLSLQGSDATDYTIAYTGSTFAVNPAVYTVHVTGSETYGGSPTFAASPTSGPTQPFSGTLTCTTVNGGSQLSTLNAGGNYTIDSQSCSGLSLTGTDAGNYQIAYVGQKFTVSRATWSVTVSGAQYYGGFSSFAPSPSTGPSQPYHSGVLTCSTVNGGMSITPTLGDGSYTIDHASCSGLSLQGADSTNYTIAYIGGTFKVSGIATSTTTESLSTSGSKTTITAKVHGSPSVFAVTGTVSFVATTKHGVVVNCSGGNLKSLNSSAKATCSLSGLSSADSPYSVTVRYSGNAYFSASTSAPKKFTG